MKRVAPLLDRLQRTTRRFVYDHARIETPHHPALELYSSSSQDIQTLRMEVFPSDSHTWNGGLCELHNVFTMIVEHKNDWLRSHTSFARCGRYFAIIDGNPGSTPLLHLAPPYDGHWNEDELAEAVRALLDVVARRVLGNGRLIVKSDDRARNEIISTISSSSSPFGVAFTPTFTWTNSRLVIPQDRLEAFNEVRYLEQKTKQLVVAAIIPMQAVSGLVCPPGFTIDNVDPDGDVKTIHECWESLGQLEDRRVMRQLLHNLPSVAIRRECNGRLAAWEHSSAHLTMSNMHTLPEYRHAGLGSIAAMELMRKYVSLGLRVNAHVADYNTKGRLWEGSGYLDWHRDPKNGEPVTWHLTQFERNN